MHLSILRRIYNMGNIVENNVVHMEWQKSGWLQTSGRNKQSAFIFASQDYDAEDGSKVTVFFTAQTAFIVYSEDEGLWSAEEFIPVIKKNMSGGFPYNLEEYVAVIDSGETTCIQSVLERFGIAAHKEDIEARLADVAPYGYETEYTP